MSYRNFLGQACGAEAEKRLFEGFTFVSQPLPGYDAAGRESRVFGRRRSPSGESIQGTGCDYGSHVLTLAVMTELGGVYKGGRSLYLLVQHGGGREVWSIPSFFDGGDFERALIAMPERLQYATLYTLYNMARGARTQAADETAAIYAKAHIEKRLKTKRRNNRKYVEIIPEVKP